MSVSKLTTDVAVISALPDAPTETATELKAKFDFGAEAIKSYINDTLTEEIDDTVAAKQDAITLAASRAVVSDSSGKIAASAVTSAQLGYLSGVTSAIQTQLNTKQKTISYGTSAPTGGSDGDIYIQYA